MIRLDVTQRELIMILSAMSACNRTGGGSEMNTALCRLQDVTGYTAEPTLTIDCQRIAHDEYVAQGDDLLGDASHGMLSESDCFGEID